MNNHIVVAVLVLGLLLGQEMPKCGEVVGESRTKKAD